MNATATINTNSDTPTTVTIPLRRGHKVQEEGTHSITWLTHPTNFTGVVGREKRGVDQKLTNSFVAMLANIIGHCGHRRHVKGCLPDDKMAVTFMTQSMPLSFLAMRQCFEEQAIFFSVFLWVERMESINVILCLWFSISNSTIKFLSGVLTSHK